MKNIILSILFLISFTFSSVDVILEIQKNDLKSKSYHATLYNQSELPSGIDSNSFDSLGISHIYISVWNTPPYYFKSDILISNLVLTKEKLINRLNDVGDVKNIMLEKLNEPVEETWIIKSLEFED